MVRRLIISAAMVAATMSASPVRAGEALLAGETLEAPKERPEGWHGQADLGFLASSGNTETSNLNAGLELEHYSDPWLNVLRLQLIRATEMEVTTSERYQIGYKAEYGFGEHSYAFGTLDYEKDEFAGLDRRTTESAGYGRRMLDGEVHSLRLEIGLGASQIHRTDGTTQRGGVLRAAGDYRWQFRESGSLEQTLIVESGSENTYLESVSRVRLGLNDHLDLVVAYTVKRNSVVPVGVQNTDTYTSVSLSYTF